MGPTLGPEFAARASSVTRVLMVSFLLFLPVRGVASPMLMGLGRPAVPALAFVGMGLVNLALSVALVKPFGIFGVAVGTAVPCALFAVGIAWVACRSVGTNVREYLSYVIVRPTIGILPVVALLVFLKCAGGRANLFHLTASHATEILPLFLSGAGSVALFLAMSVLFVFRNDPYVEFTGRLARFFPLVARREAP